MRGYCPRCKEYRSDNSMNAWGIIWKNGTPTCERCGSYVDIWKNDSKNHRKRHDNSSDVLVDNKGQQAVMRVREERKRKNKSRKSRTNEFTPQFFVSHSKRTLFEGVRGSRYFVIR